MRQFASLLAPVLLALTLVIGVQPLTGILQISPDWGMSVWLLFVTGMRRAEVIALRWSCVDFKARTLRISRN